MKEERTYSVYIMANRRKSVLYTGVTNNLPRRVWEHVKRINPGSFTSKYNVDQLVYYETFDYILDAIAAEKSIKGGSRKNKEKLITDFNPDWKALNESIGNS